MADTVAATFCSWTISSAPAKRKTCSDGRLVIWMALGLAIYFLYGKKHSRLSNEP